MWLRPPTIGLDVRLPESETQTSEVAAWEAPRNPSESPIDRHFTTTTTTTAARVKLKRLGPSFQV